jgi:tRNA pseudouridine55 synthase
MLGIVLVDKPTGMTSHDVIDVLRRRFGTRRIGHAGTLDPLASGLLVVAVGPATRFLQYLSLDPKEYVAEIRFGAATSTYDAEGEITSEGKVPGDLSDAAETALAGLRGLIEQLPPMYSAVKVDGKRLYSYARKGEEVERRARQVFIESFDIQKVNGDTVTARVVCSGGTYVRTLAHDLGIAVGCGAHLTGLRRTGAGRFSAANAAQLDSVGPVDVLPLLGALAPMPVQQLDEADARFARDGRAVPLGNVDDDVKLVALCESSGALIGVARADGRVLRPECVLPQEVANHV